MTAILYVIKWSLDQNNFSFFLYCFWLFLVSWITVKPIKVILIYSIIYTSSIVILILCVLDLKSPSSYSSMPYFFDCWLVCIIFIGLLFIDTETCPWVLLKTASGPYQIGHTYLIPPQACEKLWKGCRFLSLHLSQSINWLSSRNFLKLLKFEVVYVSVFPRGTKAHWVNPSQLFSERSKYFQQ